MAAWQCVCGFKFGDTRASAAKAFKSSSVLLCGQRVTGSKSKWPSIYNQSPFNAIEVRTRDTFFRPHTSIQQRLLEDFFLAILQTMHRLMSCG